MRGLHRLSSPDELRMLVVCSRAVRGRVLRSVPERRRIRTAVQGPEIPPELVQRSPVPVTARMLAWKQPFIQRVRNSSLVEGLGMDNNRVQGGCRRRGTVHQVVVSVGEHSGQRRIKGITPCGASGKANVGISNDQGGEIPPRRKTKVSRATSIGPGQVRSQVSAEWRRRWQIRSRFRNCRTERCGDGAVKLPRTDGIVR
eukprot:TRINITY_DN331_c0_g1_i1.p1 TRINITY_DN331_c0_g1~~TRINITY_DN331_c0_g1_i1.p1  ORF type:complete len:200 (-),score=-62.23 TRINITY_DN331_c0_g1_i1:340-939(-)